MLESELRHLLEGDNHRLAWEAEHPGCTYRLAPKTRAQHAADRASEKRAWDKKWADEDPAGYASAKAETAEFDRVLAAYAAPAPVASAPPPPPSPTPPALPAPPRALQVLDDVELEDTADPEWLVTDILQTDSYAVLYGDSGGGKTFVALDWALCIATGTPWRGHAVKRGPVVYVGAEGKSGFKRRVRAWKRAHGYTGRAGVHFINATVNVRDGDAVKHLVAAILAKLGAARPVLIVLDTLNRHLAGGDENSSKDIGLANAAASALREATGATVMFVHHCRKGDEQERGHSSLRNAADTMAHLRVADDGTTRELTCTKQREADEFAPLTFALRKEGESMVLNDSQQLESGALAGPNDALALARLVELYHESPAPVGQWNTVTPLSERTMTRVRSRLEKGGLVERVGQRGGFQPTAKGQAAHRARSGADFSDTAPANLSDIISEGATP